MDAASAAQRAQRWCSQLPFNEGSFFAQRLAMDGLTQAQWEYLLAEPVEALRARMPATPAWLTQLLGAYARPADVPLPET